MELHAQNSGQCFPPPHRGCRARVWRSCRAAPIALGGTGVRWPVRAGQRGRRRTSGPPDSTADSCGQSPTSSTLAPPRRPGR
jgi:hypothetical protein